MTFIEQLIEKNRSYRRFNQNKKISKETLFEFVNLARLSASGANKQPLKYILSYKSESNKKIFEHLTWAGYLKDWNGPKDGERPSAYIICLHDKNISDLHFNDDGIAAQSILLGAVEKGLGGCIFWSINRKKLRKSLQIPNQYKIIQVIALGEPIEQIVIETMKDNNCEYWRDEYKVHHVPKRALDELILEL